MNHEISLAVWDLPSPVVIGRRTTLKAGISCPCGCSLARTTIDVRDEQGATIGSGRIGPDVWPGSSALHWVELDVTAPDVEGAHTWTVHATAPDEMHAQLEGTVRVLASRPPEHRVTIDLIEQGSGRRLADVELRVGAFRATTDEEGRAQIDVPAGRYDVHAWKIGYDLLSIAEDITNRTTLRLERAVAAQAEQPYWM